MRKLNYKLADGTIVKTYAEAMNSEQPFTELMVEIKKPLGHISPVRERVLKAEGKVTKTTCKPYRLEA